LQLRDGVIQVTFETLWKKNGEDNQKASKIGWVVNQALAFNLEHDKIRAWWGLDILLESMLERVWWCKYFKMEFWSRTICCPMSCSNGGKHMQVGGGKRSHVVWRVVKKGKCYCWFVIMLQEERDVDQP
jgi:hypothetical protein